MSKNRFAVRPLWLALLPLAFVTWSAVEGQIPMTKPKTEVPRSGADSSPAGPPNLNEDLTPPLAPGAEAPNRSPDNRFPSPQTTETPAAAGSGSTPNSDADRQVELQRLLQLYETLAEDKRAELRQDLKTLLTEIFEQRQNRRAAEIADIEKRLTKLKELHKKREELKDSIIGNRLRQLLEDSEGLGWGDDSAAGGAESGSSLNPFSLLSGFGSQGGMMSSGSGFFGPRGTAGGGMNPLTPRAGDASSSEPTRPRTTRPIQRRRVNNDGAYFDPAPEGKRQ